MPSYAPAKQPCHKVLSQDVPRPKKVNFDWHMRASNALPKLMAARERINPYHSDYTHWSEAIGHMHRVLEGGVKTNAEAKLTFQQAQRAVARALSLAAIG